MLVAAVIRILVRGVFMLGVAAVRRDGNQAKAAADSLAIGFVMLVVAVGLLAAFMAPENLGRIIAKARESGVGSRESAG